MAFRPQKPSLLQIASGPLKGTAFECLEIEVQEQLSEPFTIVLKGQLLGKTLHFKELMGKPMGFVLALGREKRFFHGCLDSIEQLQVPLFPKTEPVFYRLVLSPLFALLRHTQDCRIFQEQSPLDIIKTLLRENNVLFKDRTTQCGKQQREFCVQYNESHFHFVSRLMEEYGISYYFTMTDSEHCLVLTDDVDGYQALRPSSYDYEPTRGEEPKLNRIIALHQSQRVVPQGVGLGDFFFETPDKKLYANRKGTHHAVPGQVYHYPGKYSNFNEGEALVKLRLQAEEFIETLLKGETSISGMSAGAKFQVKHHPDDALNKGYVAFRVVHRLTLHGQEKGASYFHAYTNEVTVFPDNIPHRPLQTTPKPRIYGTQTAVVTGKAGEEIWTEVYGRVKVKFHWDIRSKADETSSCWVRVSYPLASQGWGFLSTPRVGQEVVISYLDGDPDQPLVVGCVYNGTHKPPYLPNEPTKSTFKSNSSKGGEGFNELRFEDKKDAEEVYLHAQKHAVFVIEDSETKDIQTGSSTTTIHRGDRAVVLKGDDKPTQGKGDDSLTLVKGSRHVELQAKGSGKGNLSTTLHRGDVALLIKHGDQTTTLEAGNHELTLKKGNRTVRVHGDDHVTVTSGNVSIDVKGGDILVHTSGHETHKVGRNMKLSIGGNLDIQATGKIHMDAKMGIKLVGNAGGVNISGLTVGIQGTTTVNINAKALVGIKGAFVNIN
ncbi:MAG: type VI secretion system Vgr family protein [Alphaproteobacteria bacterium]